MDEFERQEVRQEMMTEFERYQSEMTDLGFGIEAARRPTREDEEAWAERARPREAAEAEDLIDEGGLIDAGMDWEVDKIAEWTNVDFATGLYAGVHLSPGGLQHECPTWEVLDVAYTCKFEGLWALPSYSSMAGIAAGVLLDRASDLFRWYVRFTLGPLRFLQGFFLAWCYGLSKYATARLYCTWTMIGALIMTPAAPLSLRLLALAYECRLASPYYAGDAEVSFWFSSVTGVIAVVYIFGASFPWIRSALLRFVQARMTEDAFHRLIALPLRGVGQTLLPPLVLLSFVPGNAALVCTACVVLPSHVAARLSGHPWLGFLAHVLLRVNAHGELSTMYHNFRYKRDGLRTSWPDDFYRCESTWPEYSILQMIYGARFYDAVVREHCWEDKETIRQRQASWKKYRKVNLVERRKAKRRERRLELEALLCELPRLPTDVHDTVLAFAGAPRGRDAPDLRSYALFRQRPKRVEPNPMDDLIFNQPRMAMTAVAAGAILHTVLPTSVRQRIARRFPDTT